MAAQLFSAILLSTSVAALALPEPMSLVPRETIVWTNPDGLVGTVVRFGDERVYIGECTPDKIMDTVYGACIQGACVGPVTVECGWDDGGTHEVTINFEDSLYQSNLQNGLIDGVRAAMKFPEMTIVDSVWSSIPGGCSTCPPANGHYIDVHTIPAHPIITHETPDRTSKISFWVTNGGENNPGLCEVMTKIGEAVAGAINAGAAGAFGLGSLACG